MTQVTYKNHNHLLNKFYVDDCVHFMQNNVSDNCVDLIVTSPPYDDLRDYNGYNFDFKNIANETC